MPYGHPSMNGQISDLDRRLRNMENGALTPAAAAAQAAGGSSGAPAVITHERLSFTSQFQSTQSYPANTVSQPKGLDVFDSDATGTITYTQTAVLERVFIHVAGVYAVAFLMDLAAIDGAGSGLAEMTPNSQLDIYMNGGQDKYLMKSTHAAREVRPMGTNRWGTEGRVTRYEYNFLTCIYGTTTTMDPWLNVGNGGGVATAVQAKCEFSVTRVC